MNTKSLLFLFLLIVSISLVSASWGTYKQNEVVNIIQSGGNGTTSFTYCNISKVVYPNSSTALGQKVMTNINDSFNYTFSSTSALGDYVACGVCGMAGQSYYWCDDFTINLIGKEVDISQSIFLIGQIGFMVVLLIISFTFDKQRWKLKTFFIICSLLMGLIILNSIKLIMNISDELISMMDAGLILGITIISFMIAWFLIKSTIEVFNTIKEKRGVRWS